MSESLVFLIESLIRSFLGKKRARKAERGVGRMGRMGKLEDDLRAREDKMIGEDGRKVKK